jgi:hypothetical protein
MRRVMSGLACPRRFEIVTISTFWSINCAPDLGNRARRRNIVVEGPALAARELGPGTVQRPAGG